MKGNPTHPQAGLEPREYERPISLAAVLTSLAQRRRGTRLVAGATDIVVELARGGAAQRLIDLSALAGELGGVAEDADNLYVGALATHNDVLAAPAFRRHALPLYQACGETGTPLLRTRATVVGNCVTAKPENDALVALVALGAEADLLSAAGARSVPLEDLYADRHTSVLDSAELVRRIRVAKLGPGRRGIFLKLGLRPSHSHALVNAAVVLDVAGASVRSARIVLGGVAPTVLRARAAENALAGAQVADAATREAAVACALRELDPEDDVRGSAAYRRAAVAALLRRALARIAGGTEAETLAREPVRLEMPAPAPRRLPFDGMLVTTLNGAAFALPGAGSRTLLAALRDGAGLTGPKEGCGEGECGSCTVWLDGRAVVSCIVPAPQAHGGRVTTIEGLAPEGALHPLQRAFVEHAAVQCGFCIPGMLMAAANFIAERPACSAADARAAIAGNICRCTGYRKIVSAIEAAAARAHAVAP